jgi:hypothetical protein
VHRKGPATETLLPSAGKAIPALARHIADLPTKVLREKLRHVLVVRKILRRENPKDLKMLIGALRGAAKRFNDYADALESDAPVPRYVLREQYREPLE